jgi:hypothetical protein
VTFSFPSEGITGLCIACQHHWPLECGLGGNNVWWLSSLCLDLVWVDPCADLFSVTPPTAQRRVSYLTAPPMSGSHSPAVWATPSSACPRFFCCILKGLATVKLKELFLPSIILRSPVGFVSCIPSSISLRLQASNFLRFPTQQTPATRLRRTHPALASTSLLFNAKT